MLALAATPFVASAGESDRQYAIDNYHKYIAEAEAESNSEKEASIEQFREYFRKNGHRTLHIDAIEQDWRSLSAMLLLDGRFSDMEGLKSGEEVALDQRDNLVECYYRLAKIAMAYRDGEATLEEVFTDSFQRSIIYYGDLEIRRSNMSSRFHGSCFAMPTGAVNIYFSLLDVMERIEAGEVADPQQVEACDMLKIIALQSWTQPLRNDYTDEDVSQVDRFRNHVWWVGGNGLAFRSILPTACMYRSIPMIDVLSVVSQGGIGVTSQATNATAFWTEGFTADGAGWGHGMQSLIWGYPITGTIAALELMSSFQATSWERELDAKNKHALLNFLQGSNWYHYRGSWVTGVDRTSYRLSFMHDDKKISSAAIVEMLLRDWRESFTSDEVDELKQLLSDMQLYKSSNISMTWYPEGLYNGTRYFFNNDDLFKKNDRYHLMINMASVRVDGLESAINFADEYNFCTDDGATLFMRTGKEYNRVLGAYDVLSYPGVTARQGMDRLEPVTNWRGYSSKHNFAGGATFGGESAVAGYLFEKMNGSEKEGTNDKGTNIGKNEIIYGVKAYKSYFIMGDYLVALGAGITNLKPELEGDIHTTLDQTERAGRVSIMGSNGKMKELGDGTHSMFIKGKPAWVMQDGKFAYRVIGDYCDDAQLSIETRKTDWVKMSLANASYKGASTSADVLQLWINHGQTPQDDTYGYEVYMGDGVPSIKPTFKVLSNTSKLQAVESRDGATLGAVIYDSTQLVKGREFSVISSVTSVLLVERGADGVRRVVVTDPTMSVDLDVITLTINGEQIEVPMPKAELTGKPVVVEF